ncbi:BshB3 potential contributor to bacillithiol synthesis [Alkalicoccobacillus porphyridii]|uniref:BshB3 potential contributor to bacillithiol synthesis n=1 Tax=Alkalicoccobacillus porphyridii TaxID=2597270 RepID=A0A554A449_9BACI|nr:BshB3 potential contributor to bacillithiol synthesis [Alkalicoccobacillus porphyridii]TSB48463.1 BshB3 potential contributor to bacillithiol synthesis [Alkalicoccobacillus porphyridii]
MTFLLIFTGLICVIGLVITLIYINITDSSYSSEKSFRNLSWAYLLLIPIAIFIVIGLAYLL